MRRQERGSGRRDDAVPAALPHKGERSGEIGGRTMQAHVEPNDIQTTRRLAREIGGGFNGVTAAHQKQGFLQRRWEKLAEALVQFEAGDGEHAVLRLEAVLSFFPAFLDSAAMLVDQRGGPLYA